MTDGSEDIARLALIADDLSRIWQRTCEPNNSSNPRYHALSSAVSGVDKALASLRAEDA